MKIFHVVAMANNRVIGKGNHLPWHFSSDLKHFKKLTTDGVVIMGRKTFDGIGKRLPDRENRILTSNLLYPTMTSTNTASQIYYSSRQNGYYDDFSEMMSGREIFLIDEPNYVNSLKEAMQHIPPDKKCFIIGGADLFAQTINIVDGIFLTRIYANYEGDTFYPEIPSYFRERLELREILQEINPKVEVRFYENTRKP